MDGEKKVLAIVIALAVLFVICSAAMVSFVILQFLESHGPYQHYRLFVTANESTSFHLALPFPEYGEDSMSAEHSFSQLTVIAGHCEISLGQTVKGKALLVNGSGNCTIDGEIDGNPESMENPLSLSCENYTFKEYDRHFWVFRDDVNQSSIHVKIYYYVDNNNHGNCVDINTDVVNGWQTVDARYTGVYS